MKLMQLFMRVFYYLLYHPMAFFYDRVADTVSFGHWRQWVLTAADKTEGGKILELGFGPGHLQAELARRGKKVFGLDESAQMARLCKRRVEAVSGRDSIRINRGHAEELPFASHSLDCVVATFPSEYIFELATMLEIKRVLKPNGLWITLVGVQIGGNSIGKRLLRWTYLVTGQAPRKIEIPENFKKRFQESGWQMELSMETFGEDRLYYFRTRANYPADHPDK